MVPLIADAFFLADSALSQVAFAALPQSHIESLLLS
jgi:hypothetical protein